MRFGTQSKALKDCEVLRIEGIDGNELLNSNIRPTLLLQHVNVGVQVQLGLA